MSAISERVRNFIFEFVDSAELLEVLLLLRSEPAKSWSIQALSESLRSNPDSIEKRIVFLAELRILTKLDSNPQAYRYSPDNLEHSEIIDEIASIYQIQRHRIYEIIFSPLKTGRDFADAFRIKNSRSKKEEQND